MDAFDFVVNELFLMQDDEQSRIENNQKISESFVERILLRGYAVNPGFVYKPLLTC